MRDLSRHEMTNTVAGGYVDDACSAVSGFSIGISSMALLTSTNPVGGGAFAAGLLAVETACFVYATT